MHLPNCIFKFVEEDVLQQVSLGSGLQRSINIFIAIESSEHDHASVRKILSHCRDCFNASKLRHSQVHQGDIRPMQPVQLECLMTVCPFRHDCHVRHGIDQGDETLAH